MRPRFGSGTRTVSPTANSFVNSLLKLVSKKGATSSLLMRRRKPSIVNQSTTFHELAMTGPFRALRGPQFLSVREFLVAREVAALDRLRQFVGRLCRFLAERRQ